VPSSITWPGNNVRGAVLSPGDDPPVTPRWGNPSPQTPLGGDKPPGARNLLPQRARLRRRSVSRMSTERAEICSQPRAAKSASALLTVSLDAPTSWASSS